VKLISPQDTKKRNSFKRFCYNVHSHFSVSIFIHYNAIVLNVIKSEQMKENENYKVKQANCATCNEFAIEMIK
jgi:uncharacterized protein YktB (UPF0637 family)